MKSINHSDKIKTIREILSNDEYNDIQKYGFIKRVFGLYKRSKNNPNAIYSLTDIQDQIQQHTGLSFKEINRKTNKREVVLARQLAHAKSVRLTNEPLEVIGLHFGGKDHATVLYSCKTVKNCYEVDRNFRELHGEFLNS